MYLRSFIGAALVAIVVLAPTAVSATTSNTDQAATSGSDWQTRANVAVDVIRESYPEAFTESLLDEASFKVRFRDDIPSGVEEILGDVGVPFELVGDAGFTETELSEASAALLGQVLEQVGPGVPFITEPVAGTNEIKVVIDPVAETAARGESPNLDTTAIEASLDDALIDLPADTFDVSVSLEEGSAVVDEGWGQAGGNELQDNTGAPCTSAFVVKSIANADLGILTAAHCPNTMQQISSNGNYWFSFRQSHYGLNGDMQWMRSPVMMDPWFHQNYGLGAPVRTVATAGSGTPICHFGVTSGSSCGWVKSLGIQVVTADGVDVRGITSVEGADLRSGGGDSGGPWFNGTTAYGIHKGAAWNANPRYFTPVRKAEAQFGVRVCLEAGC